MLDTEAGPDSSDLKGLVALASVEAAERLGEIAHLEPRVRDLPLFNQLNDASRPFSGRRWSLCGAFSNAPGGQMGGLVWWGATALVGGDQTRASGASPDPSAGAVISGPRSARHSGRGHARQAGLSAWPSA